MKAVDAIDAGDGLAECTFVTTAASDPEMWLEQHPDYGRDHPVQVNVSVEERIEQLTQAILPPRVTAREVQMALYRDDASWVNERDGDYLVHDEPASVVAESAVAINFQVDENGCQRALDDEAILAFQGLQYALNRWLGGIGAARIVVESSKLCSQVLDAAMRVATHYGVPEVVPVTLEDLAQQAAVWPARLQSAINNKTVLAEGSVPTASTTARRWPAAVAVVGGLGVVGWLLRRKRR